jgi:DNA-binding IclR family transcriptional regulator
MKNSFTKEDTSYRAPAVSRAFRILKLLAGSSDALGVSDLARATGASKGSIHGVLIALRAEDAVEEVAGKKFRLGPLVEALGKSRRGERSLGEVCGPCLQRLARDTGQTVLLGVPEGERLRIEAVAEGTEGFRIGAAPGFAIPLYAGATGKVFFAWGDTEIPDELPRFTPTSFVDREELAREVIRVRERGVAFDRGEYLQAVAAVAAPVLRAPGRLEGILYTVGFLDQSSEPRLQEIGEKVRTAALSVSRELS